MLREMRRKLALPVVALALLCALGEIVGFVGLRFAGDRWPTPASLADARSAIASGADDEHPGAAVRPGRPAGGPIQPWQVVHPYLGYVLTPSANVNELGFSGPAPPFGPRSDGDSRFVVGVFGGSVADDLARRAQPAFARALGAHACFREREVELVDFALPGMKQPQQLLALAYLLALDVRLDLVVTLDGFNEVVLPVAENESQGVFPFYPRSWRQQIAGLRDVAWMQRVGALEYASERRRSAAQRLDDSALRHSFLANLVWRLADRALERDVGLRRVDLALHERSQPAGGYMATGPKRSYANDDERYRDLASVWSRATRAMSDLARASGTPSFHFLQPNQRVEGSKPMSEAERAVALRPGHPYDAPARRGYPQLVREAEALASAGVAFTDLTRVFADVPDPLYSDDCCHVNDRGLRLIARAMAAEVVAATGDDCAIPPAAADVDR